MKSKGDWLLFALLLTSVLACIPGVGTQAPTATPVPTATAEPTQTALPPTATPLPTATKVPLPTATRTPTPTLPPASPTPVPTPTAGPTDTGWFAVSAGIEMRILDVLAGSDVERVTVVRLDPRAVRFRVAHVPGETHTVRTWARQMDALLVVNAGYFTPEYHVTGLTISDGQRHGTPYGDYAGMFAVTDWDAVSVRWLRASPYDGREPLREAVQCFPVLVKPGGVMGFPASADDGRVARRTVVAQDRDGRILFAIAPRGYLSLHVLATWLATSDLGVDVALNLDGGPSSGLWLTGEAEIDSLLPVPAVIAVMKR